MAYWNQDSYNILDSGQLWRTGPRTAMAYMAQDSYNVLHPGQL